MNENSSRGMTRASSTASDGRPSVATLSERLRDRTTLRFMGNCKCGNCQLVSRPLLDEAIRATSVMQEALETIRAATGAAAPRDFIALLAGLHALAGAAINASAPVGSAQPSDEGGSNAPSSPPLSAGDILSKVEERKG